MKTAKELEVEIDEEMNKEKEEFARGLIRQAIVDSKVARKKYYQAVAERGALLGMTVSQICKERHFIERTKDAQILD